jgi:hypothetical protein
VHGDVQPIFFHKVDYWHQKQCKLHQVQPDRKSVYQEIQMLNHRDIGSFSLNKVRDKIGKHLGLTSREFLGVRPEAILKSKDLHFSTEEKSLDDTKLKMSQLQNGKSPLDLAMLCSCQSIWYFVICHNLDYEKSRQFTSSHACS